MIPAWASDCIQQQIDAFQSSDHAFVETVRRLRLWPVYADLGGCMFIGADGQVYSSDHDLRDVELESHSGWRTTAWVAALKRVPELRALLPVRPEGTPDCPSCDGNGCVKIGTCEVGCGSCWGLGWQQTFAPTE